MRIHFIGIGGIGLSGLALYLQGLGHEISGSDISPSSLLDSLSSEGIKVCVPHSAEAINNLDMVIYSAIIKEDNVELREARRKNIKVYSRKEAIKLILKDKRVFSICGAHGKSSTSAMLSAILPSYSSIIGAHAKEFNSNVRLGDLHNIIFEADESDASFLNSSPYCALVTNAEPEHMEYYSYDFNAFYAAYLDFLTGAQKRVINAEDSFLSGLHDLNALRLYPKRDIKELECFISDGRPYTKFSLSLEGRFIEEFCVCGFGGHNLTNASLAIIAALDELPVHQIKDNLRNFIGIKKRFDILSSSPVIIDDYAHHPTEIKATIKAVKKYMELRGIKDLHVIWQPHKYSRTIFNLDGFVESFAGVSSLSILPIWSAQESPIDIPLREAFKSYEPLFIDDIYSNLSNPKLNNDDEGGDLDGSGVFLLKGASICKRLNTGLIIGFGAGDISAKLRGEIIPSTRFRA